MRMPVRLRRLLPALLAAASL
ncbi:MAG: hypothetical protein RLZ32_2196, partial [Gemmatimonadota bacterium]